MIIASVSAISADIKDSYERQETMLVKISGDIREPITFDDIELKRGHIDVPFEYDIKRIGSAYYLWGLASSDANNYTLWIKDVATSVSGVTKKVDFSYNFTVSDVLTDYYIEPAVILSNEDFEIIAYNNLDVTKEITVDFPESREINLQPGENSIAFSISVISGLQEINFSVGKYSVKAEIIGSGEEENVTNEEEINFSETKIIFSPQKIMREVFSGEEESYPIKIINDGKDIESISFEYNKNVFSISPELPKGLKSGEEFTFNLSMKTSKDLSEELVLTADDSIFTLPVEATISELTVPEKNNTGNNLFYCDELAGRICEREEVCSGETMVGLDGLCCQGSCETMSSGSSISWIGYLVSAIALLVIIFIYYKYKKVKPEKNQLKKRISEAEKRLP